MSLFGKYEIINIMGNNDPNYDIEVFNRHEREILVPTDYLNWQSKQKQLLKEAKTGKVNAARESKFKKEISLRATEQYLHNEYDKTVKSIEQKYSLVLLTIAACGIATALGYNSLENQEVLLGFEQLSTGIIGGTTLLGSSYKCLKRLKKTDDSLNKVKKIKKESNIR